MTTYATFTETNDHEGETWRWYIPVEGNEDGLKRLAEIVTETSDDETGDFHLDLSPISEDWVDARVALRDSGYMDAHTKLAGRFKFPTPGDGTDPLDATSWSDYLYKGGVAGLLTGAE